MFVHKRCVQADMDVDWDDAVFGRCGICGNRSNGTIYHVIGTPRDWEVVKGGVTYRYVDGELQEVPVQRPPKFQKEPESIPDEEEPVKVKVEVVNDDNEVVGDAELAIVADENGTLDTTKADEEIARLEAELARLKGEE